MTPEEYQRIVMMEEALRSNTRQQPAAPVGQRAQGIVGAIGGLLGGIGRAVGPGLQQASRAIYGDDEITRLRRQNAFQAMTLNPNQALITANSAQIQNLQEQQLAMGQANATAQYLRSIGKYAEADLIERNPELASVVLGKEFTKESTYAPQLDPTTGQYYVTVVDPNGVARRVDVKGAIGETPEQEAQREMQSQITLQDRQTAMNRGVEAMNAANILQGNVSKYAEALAASEGGAQSGAVRQYLPALNAQTAELRRLGSLLGIDIINSATFGALSATELNLALSTGLDLSLSPEELQADLKKRLAASQKLYDEYMKIARELSSGDVLYSAYIKSIPNTPLVPPQDEEGNFLVSPAVWDRMTRDDKVKFIEAGSR